MKFWQKTETAFRITITSILLMSSHAFAYNATLLSDQLTSPWAIAVEPLSGDVLITEKAGRVLRFNLNSRKLTAIGQINDATVFGQGGLMDIAISPDYQQSSKLYFTYAKTVKGGVTTALGKANLNTKNKKWQLTNWQELFVSKAANDSGRHFGSRIAFGKSEKLFFSIGDRGVRANGQDLTTHAGSILRLNLDGSVPSDNPFLNRPPALPEIYSYGHRNPQGLVYIKESDRLLAAEHGPRGGDEINLVLPGVNYGWPIISYGKEYWGPVAVGESTAKAGMEQPLMQYTPSIAPSSMLYYQGLTYPKLAKSLLLGSLALRHLSQVRFNKPVPELSSGKRLPHKITRWLTDIKRRIRDIAVLNDGRIIMVSDRGELLLLER